MEILESDFNIIQSEYGVDDITFEEFVHEINLAKSGPILPFGDTV